MSSTLTSLTLPLGETPCIDGLPGTGGLNSLLAPGDAPEPGFAWLRRGSGLLGFGEILRFTASGPDRFTEADQWWRALTRAAEVTDPLALPGSGPLAFGSFAFSKTSPFESRLVVPELILGARDGQVWATLLSVSGPLTTADVHAAIERWLPHGLGFPGAAGGLNAPEAPGVVSVEEGSLGEAAWQQAVAAGVERIQQSSVEKVVLARDVVATLAKPSTAGQILSRLAGGYQDCWSYRVDDFIGATPEMLIQVMGRVAQARVLAGTLDRREADERNAGETELDFAERVLAGSAKQRYEHHLAIESLLNSLEPFTLRTDAHEEPFILELPNVWHLASDVKAELLEAEGHVPSPLAVVNALHPTAAVCGTPTLQAGALIRELEHLDRGPYAGPVGWLDASGNGEWGIALRGGILESPTSARLFAGCGVVEASDPASELAETWSKFRPMLQALGE